MSRTSYTQVDQLDSASSGVVMISTSSRMTYVSCFCFRSNRSADLNETFAT